MKSLFLSSILLSSTISGAIITPELLHKRMAQLPDLTALMGSATKPAVVLDQKPQLRPNAKRQILRFGPFTLPPLKVIDPPIQSIKNTNSRLRTNLPNQKEKHTATTINAPPTP